MDSSGAFVQLIDLKLYLDQPALARVLTLYEGNDWQLELQIGWAWKFADVCALYFRARQHAEIFGSDLDQARALYRIEKAITDYMQDEFS